MQSSVRWPHARRADVRPHRQSGPARIVREIVDGDADDIDDDVAVYTDIAANYTFTRHSDGSVTVDHTGFDDGEARRSAMTSEETVPGPMSDGTDRLFNIERSALLRWRRPFIPELKLMGPEVGSLSRHIQQSTATAIPTVPTSWAPALDRKSTITAASPAAQFGSLPVIPIALRFGEIAGGAATITCALDLAGASTAAQRLGRRCGLRNNDNGMQGLLAPPTAELQF